MSVNLIKHAEILRAKYAFELEKCFDAVSFLKDKFINDQKNIKKLCNNLYKKIKYV
jgi:hypothetical protein